MISPSFLNYNFTRSRNLHWQTFFFFFLSALWIFHPTAFWPLWLQIRLSAVNLIQDPLCMTSCFFLVAPILPHRFWLLIVWFWCIYGQVSEFVLLGFHGASQTCRLFFINFRKFSAFTSSRILPFLGLLSFWNSCYVHIGICDAVLQVCVRFSLFLLFVL